MIKSTEKQPNLWFFARLDIENTCAHFKLDEDWDGLKRVGPFAIAARVIERIMLNATGCRKDERRTILLMSICLFKLNKRGVIVIYLFIYLLKELFLIEGID